MDNTTCSADLSPPSQTNSELNCSNWIKALSLKLLYFLCILLALGTPLLSLWKLYFLLGATLILIIGTIRLQISRVLCAILIVMFAIPTKSFLPSPGIEEGNNVFLPVYGLRTKPPDMLPLSISQFLTDAFFKQYPPEDGCSAEDPFCWRHPSRPLTIKGFSFSSDSAFKTVKYSRRVDSIDFHNVASFRGGFVNRLSMSWSHFISEMKRENMPYFVMYELSPEVTGSSLCWKGDVFWENDSQGFQHILHKSMECREITIGDVSKKVFGVSIWVDSPLAMKLKLSSPLQISSITKQIVSILSVIGILVLTVRIRFSLLLGPVAIIALTSAAIPGETLVGFENYQAYEGGNDGLTHENLAHITLINFLDGDFKEALRGGEDVFYCTPGFRYFKALARIIFGDTQLGELLPLILLPLALFFLLRVFFPIWGASLLLFTFLFVTSSHHMHNGWTLRAYTHYAVIGFAEVLGYGLLLLGTALLLKHHANYSQKFYQTGILANLLLALSIIVRPNLVLGAGLFLCYNAWSLINNRRVKDFLIISCGFLPFFLVSLHNWVYGDFISINYADKGIDAVVNYGGVGPWDYLGALKAVFSNNPGSSLVLQKVTTHLALWVENRWWRAGFFMLCFLPLFPVKWASFPLRSLCFVSLGLHTVLLITIPEGRYAYLAWMISSIIGFTLITQLFSFAVDKLAMLKCRRHSFLSR